MSNIFSAKDRSPELTEEKKRETTSETSRSEVWDTKDHGSTAKLMQTDHSLKKFRDDLLTAYTERLMKEKTVFRSKPKGFKQVKDPLLNHDKNYNIVTSSKDKFGM